MTDQTSETQIRRLAVTRRLVTQRELDACLQKQHELARGATHISLAEVMLKAGLLTRRQLQRLGTEREEPIADESRFFPGYQVLARLGAGATARVFKARQLSLDRIVAIKVLTRKLADKPEFVERFHEEGRAAAKLSHPNIVQVIDVDTTEGYHYLVLEYIDGKSVGEELAAGKVYAEREALEIVIQVARALEHAAARGFVHRDVKPSNIMLTKDRAAKLADLGLARRTTDVKAATAELGRVYGTPDYISPEQIRANSDIDFRADIYCLGATFYHMITGRVPFDGPVPATIMRKHLHARLVPPDHVRPSLSTGVGEVIETMMAKDRADRYATLSALIQDLEALARGDPPVHAQTHDKSKLLIRLDETGERVPDNRPTAGQDQEMSPSSIPLTWFLVVVIAGGVSLVLNVIQCVAR
ncbi:MAG TPA: serine/threonine-protein kinase [Phycisphaerae bacterium]|nr:serine/threonine-protein kinase [Phycisphaerae bacterium]HRY70225.1 serine/threonine-protein kinase [Phycisphaerae bacterium]HSA27440.1 serine/threonine-protein kinase [Phycisphaerae bacterium]